MLFCAEMRPLDADEINFRRKALRDAVICMGWLKLLSVTFYVCLGCLVHYTSSGTVSIIIQAMIGIVILPQLLYGLMLFLGALEEKQFALEIALWLCLLLASYNTVLGVVGCIYYIRIGHHTAHFVLAVLFALFAMSLITVICNDVLIIYAFKNVLSENSTRPEEPEEN